MYIFCSLRPGLAIRIKFHFLASCMHKLYQMSISYSVLYHLCCTYRLHASKVENVGKILSKSFFGKYYPWKLVNVLSKVHRISNACSISINSHLDTLRLRRQGHRRLFILFLWFRNKDNNKRSGWQKSAGDDRML